MKSKDTKCKMLKCKKVVFQFDTGITVNMLHAKYTKHINPYQGFLRMWNKSLVKPLRVYRRIIKNPKNTQRFLIFKNEDKCQPLLGLWTCEEISLAVTVEQGFKDVFDDKIGKLPGITSLELRPPYSVTTLMANRRMRTSIWPLKANINVCHWTRGEANTIAWSVGHH